MRTMDAVLLSGGVGTRLRPLTYDRPKPLLPVANRPMVEHILDRLPDEVDRAILAAGYRVEQIRDWADALDHRVEVVVVEEDEPLGTGGAVKNVEDELRGPFLCFNGDVLSSAPLERMIERRREANARGAIALWEVDEPQHYGVVERDGDRITRFVEKPDPGEAPSSLINAGTYCFGLEVLDMIEPNRKVSLEHEVFPAIVEKGEGLVGVPFDGHWVDCGRPEVYLEAHNILLDGEARLAEGARLEGAVDGWASLGAGARVGPGAVVRDSVLLEEATVREGAKLEAAVVGAGATVGEDARLQGCVVADGETIPEGTEAVDEAFGVDPRRPVGGASVGVSLRHASGAGGPRAPPEAWRARPKRLSVPAGVPASARAGRSGRDRFPGGPGGDREAALG